MPEIEWTWLTLGWKLRLPVESMDSTWPLQALLLMYTWKDLESRAITILVFSLSQCLITIYYVNYLTIFFLLTILVGIFWNENKLYLRLWKNLWFPLIWQLFPLDIQPYSLITVNISFENLLYLYRHDRYTSHTHLVLYIAVDLVHLPS